MFVMSLRLMYIIAYQILLVYKVDTSIISVLLYKEMGGGVPTLAEFETEVSTLSEVELQSVVRVSAWRPTGRKTILSKFSHGCETVDST